MNKKKIISLLLAVSMVLSVMAGCSSATKNTDVTAVAEDAGTETSSDSADRYDKVVVAIQADPGDLLSSRPNSNSKPKFLWNIYEALFDYDEENNLIPSLASGYTEVSDTVWNVSLFKTIYDSEGNHITADDVIFNVNWLIETGNNIKYDLFESIEKIDDYTVAYHWTEKPSADQLEFILVRTAVFSQTAFENHNFATDPIATGPFVVSSYASGSKLVLEANDNYWADNTDEDVSWRIQALHTATVQTVEFEVIAEASQAVVALEMGTVDICDYVNYAELSNFEEGGAYSGAYNVDVNLSGDYYYTMPNMASAAVGDDLNLRLAMYYSLNNEAIAMAMGGAFLPLKSLGTTYFLDYNLEWENEKTYVNTYDMDLAKEYLEASDYNGEPIVMIGSVDENVKNGMTMMQSLFAQIGINVTIQTFEESMLNTIIAEQTGWDFVTTRLGGSTLVSSWNTLFNNNVHDGMTTNWLKDATLQKLYETAIADETHDDEHVKECMDYAFSIGMVYPFSGMASSVVYSKNIKELYYREGYVTAGCSIYAGQ